MIVSNVLCSQFQSKKTTTLVVERLFIQPNTSKSSELTLSSGSD